MNRRKFGTLAAVCILGLGLLGPQGAKAQEKDITGTWQGTLDVQGTKVRIVFKISKDDVLKGMFYQIDQKVQVPVSTVTRQGGAVKIEIAAAGVTYEGKLSPESNLLDGNWKQAGMSLPLKLEHVTESAAWAIPEPAKKQEPMAKDAQPGFDIATIKPTKPGTPGKYLTYRGEMLMSSNFSLSDLISFAYGVNSKQISGIPAWAETDKYDIQGKPDVPGVPNVEQLKGMVKKLLAERFQLKFHTEKKSLSVYALEPGKGAPKLTKSEADERDLPGLGFRGFGKMFAQNATMENFCHLMQEAVLDRPVVDQTGLLGKWNFTLDWTPDESQFGGLGVKIPPPSDKADAPPPLFTAIQEQLGLKLEATKAMVDVLVIDKAEKPSDN
jgi:uncharacterized protein (TIGR03435 family)